MNVNQWREAIWESDLHATEKIVALCYADHTSDGTSVWIYDERGAQRCGMGLSTFRKKRKAVADKGWLLLVTEGRRGPRPLAATYDLATPANNAPSERNIATRNANSAPSEQRNALSEQRNALSDAPSPTSSPTSSPSLPKSACATCGCRLWDYEGELCNACAVKEGGR